MTDITRARFSQVVLAFFAVIALAFSVSFFAVSGSAAWAAESSANEVIVSADHVAASVGTKIIVPVRFKADVNLAAAELEFVYDSERLRVDGVHAAGALAADSDSLIIFEPMDSDTMRVSWSVGNEAGVAADGALLELEVVLLAEPADGAEPIAVGTYGLGGLDADLNLMDVMPYGGSVRLGYDATVGKQPVYRMYNPHTSEHLFTTDKGEYESLVAHQWIQEGVCWQSPVSSPVMVYRLYNPALGAMTKMSHHYTTDKAEADNLVANHGWQYDFEGKQVFFSASKFVGEGQLPMAGSVPAYRMYNGGLSAHHYTLDAPEYYSLTAYHGWVYEGEGFYAFPS